MKKPKAEKLPSGRWRARIQIDGERYSATEDTKKEAQDAVLRKVVLHSETQKRSGRTVGDAMDRYISERNGILSPSTIQGYKVIQRNYLQDLMSVKLDDLAQSDIQISVSEMAADGKSPKTIRNAHGLLAAVLDEFKPDLVLKTRLPQKQQYEVTILSEEDMKKVWKAAKGGDYELPILLASWLGLRMSEIRGLRFRDIQDSKIHIHTAIVAGPDGDVEKGPKTTAGDRWISLPCEIMRLIQKRQAEERVHRRLLYYPEPSDEDVKKEVDGMFIVPWDDQRIYKNFIRICKEAGVKPCRFHDLRHFAASEALALGIPNKYFQGRMGHKTDNMLKNVYQHIMRKKEDEFADIIDERMRELYDS